MLFTIAWRNIWRNKVRSLVIITSVVIGLWAGAFVNAIYWGASEDRVNVAIKNEVSHIQIHHPQFRDDYKASFTIPLTDSLIKTLKSVPAIKAYSFRTVTQGMMATASSSTGIQINGINPLNEQQVTSIYESIIEGEYLKAERKNTILVGAKLAKKMKLKLKSKVVLTYLDKDNNITSGAFKVAGIFQTQNSGWDDRNVFVRTIDLDKSLMLQNETHQVAILLNSNNAVDETISTLKRQLPFYDVEGWMQISPETGLIISTMSQFSIIFIAIILLAISFGIVNTMLMAILERTRETGMMIALGMNKMRIFMLVLFETCLLVFIGSPVGLFIAWASIQYFGKYGIDISSLAGKAMSSFGFTSVIYPSLPKEIYVQIIILVVITALVSSVFPAIKALKINPAESIKS